MKYIAYIFCYIYILFFAFLACVSAPVCMSFQVVFSMIDILLGIRGKDMAQFLPLGTTLALFLTPLWLAHVLWEYYEPSISLRAHAWKIREKLNGEVSTKWSFEEILRMFQLREYFENAFLRFTGHWEDSTEFPYSSDLHTYSSSYY